MSWQRLQRLCEAQFALHGAGFVHRMLNVILECLEELCIPVQENVVPVVMFVLVELVRLQQI